MKWTVLADNRTQNSSLQTEHGLSILLETDRHRILLDTGASDIFIRNAERLGIDLSIVDYVFISHGHSDHAGGLRHFLTINDKGKVIPLVLFGSYWYEKETGVSRFCGEQFIKPDFSSDIIKSIPHFYVFGIKIN